MFGLPLGYNSRHCLDSLDQFSYFGYLDERLKRNIKSLRESSTYDICMTITWMENKKRNMKSYIDIEDST